MDLDEITTVTAYTLSVETIVGCPVYVIECPDDQKSSTTTTTVTLPAFTTECPIGEATSYMLVEPHPTQEPVHPVEPVEPVHPVEPVEPVHPVEPVEPVHPVEPVEPVHPVEPIEEPIGEPIHSDEPLYPTGTETSSYYLPTGTGVGYVLSPMNVLVDMCDLFC